MELDPTVGTSYTPCTAIRRCQRSYSCTVHDHPIGLISNDLGSVLPGIDYGHLRRSPMHSSTYFGRFAGAILIDLYLTAHNMDSREYETAFASTHTHHTATTRAGICLHC
ncbi:hypothetical protein HBI56_083180 [Parastagonospora nodorum]|nr:hypothetical protein HBH56_103390 [Parastagonospora nodorum]KAH3929224.1 hypothetical protein HBH54_127020 [Parastagonospora nodorum]KAH3951480.1 hypothetical protein HBH53_061040 [Parastagonospora nodorum]KAH3975445.1 hypothetical protein HBH52_125810 [Parastagonospora nodorum]KAH3978795.1 hypothetical protein HBH51_062750 [Parastagonospora nodorum]